jgi:molybdopterin-guanine dinucleotide biosynthesis protein
MAIVVVGGSGRGVGKTALVCGLIAALPEFRWTAVKITTHHHGHPEPIWEESEPGHTTDTARYLTAGAARALLVAVPGDDLAALLKELWVKLEPDANVIFESNRILHHLQPDLCLAVEGNSKAVYKPSFRLVPHQKDATVALAERDCVLVDSGPALSGSKPLFHLAALERISPEMLEWLRKHLQSL